MKQSKLKIRILASIAAVIIIILTICLTIIFIKSRHQPSTTPGPEENTPQIDFSQTITSIDGSEFQPAYELGSNVNFSARFVNLSCADSECSNVSAVKLDDRDLARNQDYELKPGSIIIVILASTMENLEPGQHELTFKLTENDQIITIGVKISVEDNIPTCQDNEILENNQCVKKPEKPAEQPSNSNNASSTQNPSIQTYPDTPTSGYYILGAPNPTDPATCATTPGPAKFKLVFWFKTVDERNSWGNSNYVASIASFRFHGGGMVGDTSIGMQWINGTCRPAKLNSSVVAVIDGTHDPYTFSQLPSIVKSYPGRNAVIWVWANGGQAIEIVNDPIDATKDF